MSIQTDFSKQEERTVTCRHDRRHGQYISRGYACVDLWSGCPNCREKEIRIDENPGNGEERTETCEKHGAFIATRHVWKALGLDRWSACPGCELRKRLDKEAAEKQRQRDEATAWRVKAVQIPPRFADKTLADYTPRCAGEQHALEVANGYVRDFKDNLGAGRCLLFCGKVGTGKTHLGTSIAKAVAQAGWSSRYTTVTDLIRELRASWNRRPNPWGYLPKSEAALLEELTKFSLLVIDEIGLGFGSDAELAQISEVLDLRYRAQRPTLVISNCVPGELKRFLGDRGVDRLRENGGRLIVFDWRSHRGEADEARG
jgi:DNA replication protein DnaC